MKRTLYLSDYQTEEYRRVLKLLMQKIGVEIDDIKKFDSKQDEEVVLTVSDTDILTILDNMSNCDFIVCK